MKWFVNIQTLEELKKEYRNLAFIHHPDRGGSEQNMKEINSEYDELFEKIKNVHQTFEGNIYNTETTETKEEFKDIINRIIILEGLVVEICGSWIWITGETLLHKEVLKELKFRWSKSKKAWYYHREGYRKFGNKNFSLDDIRSMYGSEFIESTPQLKLQII